jgi:hypothetical protein
MVEKVKLRTDKEMVLGWTKTQNPNLDYAFENKFIKARGVFSGKYTKKFFKKILNSKLENTPHIEISLTTNRNKDASMVVFKNLNTNDVVCLAGIINKKNYDLKGKKGIGNKKY